MTDSIALREAWEEHPRYRYRGCAPDVDQPDRAAGNLALTLDAWSGEDRDGSEPQKEREARQEAAIDVCFGCAVMVQCDAYASSVVWVDGIPKVAEPEGVWGGRTALARHRMLIESRPEVKAAPDQALKTPQKRAVIQALARCWDPFEVAKEASRLLMSWGEASVDVRTANWQRSSIVTKLGLPKDASRMRTLAAARERGLLDGVDLVPDDGSVLAVAPPTRVPVPALARGTSAVLTLAGAVALPAPEPYEPAKVRTPSRARFAGIEGQLALWEAGLDDLADVHGLIAEESDCLETAV